MRRRNDMPNAALLILAAFAAPAYTQQYDIIDLGTLGGPVSGGFAINEFGRVAGSSTRADANVHGLLWDGGLTELAPLSGDTQSHALGINNSGETIVASYDLGELNIRGFVWRGGVVTPLGGMMPRGVNDAGDVVGCVGFADPVQGWVDHAARWSNGVLSDLGTLGGHFSYAYDIADDGRVVGVSYTANDAGPRATLWTGGAPRDLGTLGGSASQAYAINDHGAVVGWAETVGGAQHAFRFTLDASENVVARLDLGALSGAYSYAYDLNNHGEAVGTSASRAVLWTDTGIVDLNTRISNQAGWRLEQAWSINDSGWIVGGGQHLGWPHGFVLIPRDCPDLDGNGSVNLTDLAILLTHFGTPVGMHFAEGDVDRDSDVDLADLAQLLASFGLSC